MDNIVTVPEYAKLRGCSVKNVYNQIYAKRNLPGVLGKVRSGKTYLLSIDRKAVTSKELRAKTKQRIKNNLKKD